MEHRDILAGQVHTPYQWIVADEAAREAIVPSGATDLRKVCLQVDTGETYRLDVVTPPTWTLLADAPGAAAAALSAHVGQSNPHSQYVPAASKGAANGVAPLGADQKLPPEYLPPLAVTEYLGEAADEEAMLELEGQQGDWCVRADLGTVWIIIGPDPTDVEDWKELGYPTAPVTSVAGKTGAVTLGVADVSGAVGDEDSRLSNPRDWTAETVGQEEAEAGTATTRRAWTAQRVRQAIAAWWTGILAAAAEWTGVLTVNGLVSKKEITEVPYSADSGTDLPISRANGSIQRIRLTGNWNPSAWPTPAAGGEFTLGLVQDGTGGRTFTIPASVRRGGNATAWTLTATANRMDVVSFICFDGSLWTMFVGDTNVPVS